MNEARFRPVVHEVEKPQGHAPQPPARSRKTNFKQIITIILLTALVVSFISGGIYVYVTNTSVKKESTPTPTPTLRATPTATPSPTPTPEPPLDLTKIKASVLNGSGKIGEAGKVEALLEAAGFETITTGNASRFDYKETIIQAKESTSSKVVNLAKEALTKSYQVTIGDPLKATSSYDLVITVGSQ